MNHRFLFAVLGVVTMLAGRTALSQTLDRAGKDLVYYVVDRSGSISHYKLQDAFREAIVNHMMELKRETEVEIVFFSDTASRPRRWHPMDARAKQEFVENFDREFRPRGQTRLFATVAEVLNRVVAREAEYDRINVFILSDGEDNLSAPKYTNWSDVVSGLPRQWQDRHGMNVVWATVEFDPKQEHLPSERSGIRHKTVTRSELGEMLLMPDAAFNASPRRVKVGDPVTFWLLNDANVREATWNFGDGGQQSGKVVTHTFATSGLFDVEVKVVGSKGLAANLVERGFIEVRQDVPLKAEFSWRPSAVRVGIPVDFRDDSAGGPTAWNWDFPGVGTSSARHPTVTFKTPGTVNVRLRVNLEQRQSEIVKSVQVLGPLPNAEFSAEPTVQEIGKPVRLLAAENREGWRYTWLIGGEVELQGADVTWTADRTGRVSILHTVTSPDGLAEKESFIVVREGPAPLVARFKWAQDVVHINSPVSFIDESLGAPTEYRWTFGDFGTSAERNPKFTFPYPGLIPVTLTISAAERKSDVTHTVEVLPPPPNASFSVSPENPVIGTVVTCSAANEQPSEVRMWLVNGKEISSWTSTPSIVWSPTNSGLHTILHRVRGTGGVTESTQTLLVHERVRAAFDWTPKPARLGMPLKLIDSSLGPVSRWKWSDGASWTSDARSPEFTPKEVGQLSIALEVSSQDGQTDKLTQSIEVLPAEVLLVASFRVSRRRGVAPLEVSFEDRSKGPIARRLWEFGDGQTSDVGNPTHTYAAQGTYRPRLTVFSAKGEEARDDGQMVIAVRAPLKTWQKALIWLIAAVIVWIMLIVPLVIRPILAPQPRCRLRSSTSTYDVRRLAKKASNLFWPRAYVSIGTNPRDDITLPSSSAVSPKGTFAHLARIPLSSQYVVKILKPGSVFQQETTRGIDGAAQADWKAASRQLSLKNGSKIKIGETELEWQQPELRANMKRR